MEFLFFASINTFMELVEEMTVSLLCFFSNMFGFNGTRICIHLYSDSLEHIPEHGLKGLALN